MPLFQPYGRRHLICTSFAEAGRLDGPCRGNGQPGDRQTAPGPREVKGTAHPVWPALNQMAEAFERDNPLLSQLVNRAFADGELDPEQGARIDEYDATAHAQHPQKRRRPRAMGACSRKDARRRARRSVASAGQASSSDPAALKPSSRHRQSPAGPAYRRQPGQAPGLICRHRPKPQRQAPAPDHNTPKRNEHLPAVLFARHLQNPVPPTPPAPATPVAPLTAEATAEVTAEAAAHQRRDGDARPPLPNPRNSQRMSAKPSPLKREAFRLNQNRLAAPFGVDLRTVSCHLTSIFACGEPDAARTIQRTWRVQTDRNRGVSRQATACTRAAAGLNGPPQAVTVPRGKRHA